MNFAGEAGATRAQAHAHAQNKKAILARKSREFFISLREYAAG
jgi:hypothetical protein